MKDIFYQNKTNILLNTLFFLLGLSMPISLAINSIIIALFVIFSLFFFNLKNTIKSLSFKNIYIYYIFYFLLILVSVNYSYNKNIASENVIKNFIFLILPISFINIKHLLNNQNLKSFYFGLLTILIVSILKVYTTMISDILDSNFLFTNYLRENFVINGVFKIHVPYLAMLTVFSIIYTFKIKISNNNIINFWTKFILLILLISSLFLLSGFMSIIIFFIYIFVQFLKSNFSNRKKIILIFSMIFSLVVLFIYVNNMEKLERVKGSENLIFRIQNLDLKDSTIRIQTWTSTIIVISQNIWFGVGADGGMNELLKYREPLTEPFVNMHNAHNTFLEIFLRYGFFGFFNYLIILFFLIKKAFKSKDYYFIWFLVVFLVSGFTESYLQRQVGLVFFVLWSLFFFTNSNCSQRKIL